MPRISKIRDLLKEDEEVKKLDDKEIEKLEKELEKELKSEEKNFDDDEEVEEAESCEDKPEEDEAVDQDVDDLEKELNVEASEDVPSEDEVEAARDIIRRAEAAEVKDEAVDEVPSEDEIPADDDIKVEGEEEEVPADEDDDEKEFDLNDSSDVFLDDEEEKETDEAVEDQDVDVEKLDKDLKKELASEGDESDEDEEEVEEGKKKDEDEEEVEEGKGKKKDDEDEDDEPKKPDMDVEEHVNALCNGENLSEEFQKKAKTIFEAAVREKVIQFAKTLKSRYNKRLVAAKTKIEEKMVTKIDGYMDYVVEEWMTKNKLAVQHGLRTEITEEFLTDLRKLFETHNIMIPKGKENLVESLVDKLEKVENELNEQVKKTMQVNKKLNEYKKNEAFRNICEGLADTEIERLKSLASNLQYDDSYKDKLQVIKENYLSKKTKKAESIEQVTNKKPEEKDEHIDSQMASYLNVVTKIR